MKKTNPLYKRIEEIITQQRTICKEQWKNIGWAIAAILVKDYRPEDQYALLGNGLPKQIGTMIFAVKRSLESRGIPVYIKRPPGKRNIEVISLDPIYKEDDRERLEDETITMLRPKIKEGEWKHPDTIEWAKVKLLPFIRPKI